MGRFVFKLPDLGEGTAEAEIVAWHVKVGDVVAEDAPLVDMLTDKATVEMTSPEDRSLYVITSDVDEAASELLGFYRNYHSCRWVGDLLVIRLRVAPTVSRPATAEGVRKRTSFGNSPRMSQVIPFSSGIWSSNRVQAITSPSV